MILLPLLACGCQSWSTVKLAPQETGSLPKHSWVVMMTGARVPVEGGQFSRDSIVGTQGAGARFAVSRDSVAYVEERRVSASRTLGLVAGGYGLVLVASSVVLLALLASQY
jgi:hypothetical protein